VHFAAGGIRVAGSDRRDDRPMVRIDRLVEAGAEVRPHEPRLQHVEHGLSGDREQHVA
jgi:hypothetical protein